MPFRCFGTISTESSPLATSFAAGFSGEIDAGRAASHEPWHEAADHAPTRSAGIPSDPLHSAAGSAATAIDQAVDKAKVDRFEASNRTAPGSRGAMGPSFVIRGSSSPLATGAAPYAGGSPLRLDRINSAEVLGLARGVYFAYLSACSAGADPLGVVLAAAGGGRVVFEVPVLLPKEQFVPIDWLRSRNQGRGRGSRGSGLGRPTT